MNELFQEFAAAYATRNGYAIAQTLSPVAPPDDPLKLDSIWQSTNSHSVKGDIKHFIKHNSNHRRSLKANELNGWVEVYAAYWVAVGEIKLGETGKVRLAPFVSL
jgi:COP9 signalosome complex subunit 12